jgi:phosphoglycolate phosphatase-like HAD superfamily hydrolase
MPLTALLRLGGGSVHELAVAGDTPSDIESGLRAGAGIVAGVLTGDSTRPDLEAARAGTGLPGTPLILDSITGLRPHLGLQP